MELTTGPAYAAARIVAPHVVAYFAEHVDAHTAYMPAPDTTIVEALANTAFWASLRREEGYSPKISLAYVPPEAADSRLLFERALRFSPDVLTKLAPAVVRPGIHLGVWPYGEELKIWGATRSIPARSLVLEVVGPGLLVFKHRRRDAEKFANIAVLQGDEVKVIDERAGNLPDCPAVVLALSGFYVTTDEPVSVLVRLALSMRAHGRGGILLLVPAGSDAWRESIATPTPYAVSPPFTGLAARLRHDGAQASARLGELDYLIDAVAGLTVVDGAAVLTSDYDVLAFGAKIVRRRGSAHVEQITVTEPIQGIAPAIVDPPTLGGTRHLSAAQFVHDQHDALALVASQDGRFTVFAWSPCEDRVHAHRVESLLL